MTTVAIEKYSVETGGFRIPLFFVPYNVSDARGTAHHGTDAYLTNPELFPDRAHPRWIDSEVTVAALRIRRSISGGHMSTSWLRVETDIFAAFHGRLTGRGFTARAAHEHGIHVGENIVGFPFNEKVSLEPCTFPVQEALDGQAYGLWSNLPPATYQEELTRAGDKIKRQLAHLRSAGFFGKTTGLSEALCALAYALYTGEELGKYNFVQEAGDAPPSGRSFGGEEA